MMDLKIKKHSISSILLWVWLLDIFALTVMRYFLAKLGFYDGLIREFVLTVVINTGTNRIIAGIASINVPRNK